ncbi:MAG: hypothetical protein HY253_12495 [Burkholderiales bacterium]|nr:hypothetical protein [Burkholderiales bacterium]
MKFIKNILLSLITMIVLLALIELGLHIADFPATPKSGWKWDESPYRGMMNQGDQRVNQLGLRGKTFEYHDDDFVVLLVGDSQTEAGTQLFDDMPEALLEMALKTELNTSKVKVFSIASAGWGQDQQLVALRAYFEHHRANLVIDWTTPVNDYWENTFIDRSITPEAGKLKPTFTSSDANAKLETVIPTPFEFKLRTLLKLSLSGAASGKKASIEQIHLDRWMKKLPTGYDSKTQQAQQCPSLEVKEQELIESYLAGSRAYTLLTEEDVENGRSHFSPFLKNLTPRDHYAITITHRLFQELANLSQQHGAQFHILHTYRSDLDQAFREIRCVKNTRTQNVFEYDGSDWMRHLKASPLAPQLIALNINSEHALNVSKGDWHFSKEGNQLAMQALAKKIVGLHNLQAEKH